MLLLTLAYLFFIGSVFGWILELFFRRFFSSANPQRKWINPGFLVGPYMPLYGAGMCGLYAISLPTEGTWFTENPLGMVCLILLMALAMTLLEYATGAFLLHFFHVRLWDYSKQWGNFRALICPKFTFFWAILSALYRFLVFPYIREAVAWLYDHLAFSFFIGFFFGVLTIDMIYSAQVVAKVRRFAEEHEVIVRYEILKLHIREAQEKASEKVHFLLPFHSETPLREHLKNSLDRFEKKVHLKKKDASEKRP